MDELNNIWTEFYDMNSGGYQKEKWGVIYIEAGHGEAIEVFKKIFNRHPFDVACQCCGEDYYVSSFVLEKALNSDKGYLLIHKTDFNLTKDYFESVYE